MQTGEIVYLRYHGDPGVIHTRLLVGQVQGDEWVIVTPDHDVYVEELARHNPDIQYMWHSPDGRLARGVPRNQVYGFAPMTAAQYAAVMRAGRAEFDAEIARRGLGAVAAVGAAPMGGGGGAVEAAPVAAAAAVAQPVAAVPAQPGNAAIGNAGPGARDLTGRGLVWVAAEGTSTTVFGEVVAGVVAPAVEGAKTVHRMADGSDLFCLCISETSRQTFNGRPAACDGRILARGFNTVGQPERPLSEVVAASREVEMGWKIAGPRTALWCLNYLMTEGLGFEAHHERFRQLCRIDAGGWGVQEHFQTSMFLRQLIQVDQVDACNCYGVELMFRRVQTIEYAHSERAREIESKTVGGKLSLEEQYTFGSLVRQAGTLMIAPSLLEHVKQEVERDAQLSKNLRKAREERDLAKKKGGGNP